MHSRVLAFLFALVFFTVFVAASPLVSDGGISTDLVARHGSNDANPKLQIILRLCLDLQLKINACLAAIAKLKAGADISSHCGKIAVLITACVKAIVKLNLSLGAFAKLSAADKICVQAIARVCAQIIVSIQAGISIGGALVLTNILAVLKLSTCIISLLKALAVCVGGFVGVVAGFCTGFDLNITIGLCLTSVISFLGLCDC